MTIVNRVMDPSPETLATTADHFPIFICDVCGDPITNHRKAHATWRYGTTEILHVHTDKGCLMLLESKTGVTWLSDTMENHLKNLLFTAGYEESLEPGPADIWE
jgi:hypothetical protein